MAGHAAFLPLNVSATDQLREHVRNLDSRLATLKSQVRQAQQLAGLGTAAMTIAHELNNLLTPVIGYAQAAESSGDPEFMKKALRVTLNNILAVVAVSDRVLALGAAKAPEYSSVDVAEAVEEALAAMCRDLSKDGIRFVPEIPPGTRVWFDGLMLRQVLFNVFLNAREAMSEGHSGRLSVRAHRLGDRVRIEVSDTGRGIPAEILPQIFDPLHTSKSGTRNGRSRCGGLGLALCRDLVTEGGGAISAESHPGEGTTIFIELPAGR
jgi:signal transduction histidine kinase